MKTAVEETYSDVLNCLRRESWKAAAYGCDYEDAMSTSHVAFMLAYNSYRPSRGCRFTTYLYHYLRGRLYDQHAKQRHIQAHERPLAAEDDPIAPTDSDYLTNLRSELTADARVILDLIFESDVPEHDLTKANYGFSLHRLGKMCRALGWGKQRFQEAVAEIRACLQ